MDIEKAEKATELIIKINEIDSIIKTLKCKMKTHFLYSREHETDTGFYKPIPKNLIGSIGLVFVNEHAKLSKEMEIL